MLVDQGVKVSQLERLLICQDDELHIAQIVHLLLPVCDAALRNEIVRWTVLSMDVVARHQCKLESLVGDFVGFVAPDLELIAHLVPVQA